MILSICSLYGNPLHCGHLDMLEEAADISDKLIVIINNSIQVNLKAGTPFFSEKDRCRLVKALECVDEVFLSIDKDKTVVKSLKHLYNTYYDEIWPVKEWRESHTFIDYMIFCNGGDRTEETAVGPEVELCEELNIEIRYNVGGDKTQSSSELIRRASEWKI